MLDLKISRAGRGRYQLWWKTLLLALALSQAAMCDAIVDRSPAVERRRHCLLRLVTFKLQMGATIDRRVQDSAARGVGSQINRGLRATIDLKVEAIKTARCNTNSLRC